MNEAKTVSLNPGTFDLKTFETQVFKSQNPTRCRPGLLDIQIYASPVQQMAFFFKDVSCDTAVAASRGWVLNSVSAAACVRFGDSGDCGGSGHVSSVSIMLMPVLSGPRPTHLQTRTLALCIRKDRPPK